MREITVSELLERVTELEGEAREQLKTESDLLKIGRAQGRLMAFEDVRGIQAQIAAEESLKDLEGE